MALLLCFLILLPSQTPEGLFAVCTSWHSQILGVPIYVSHLKEQMPQLAKQSCCMRRWRVIRALLPLTAATGIYALLGQAELQYASLA